MNNSFNKLLIALAFFDSIFIIFVILDYTFVRGKITSTILFKTARKNLPIPVWSWPFPLDSAIYAYIFPKILYPLNNISLCCSIYTTIGIAFERWFESFQMFFYLFVLFLFKIHSSLQPLQVQRKECQCQCYPECLQVSCPRHHLQCYHQHSQILRDSHCNHYYQCYYCRQWNSLARDCHLWCHSSQDGPGLYQVLIFIYWV